MVRSASDLDVTRHCNHVMKRGNPPTGAGKRGGVARVRVHDRPDIGARAEQIPMKAPFARRPTPTEPVPIELHQRNIGRLQLLVGSTCRTDEESALVTTNTDVPRRSVRQPAPRQLAASADQGLTETCVGASHQDWLGSRAPKRRTGMGGAGYRPILEFQ